MLKCFLLGATLELAQALLTDNRVADLADLAANAAGILAAWLIAGQGRAGWGLRAAVSALTAAHVLNLTASG